MKLSVYCPPSLVEDELPATIPFRATAPNPPGNRMLAIVDRARIERANAQCPCCRRVTVEPIERPDAVVNRNGATVPGTATIVGFFCNACRHQWRVRARA